MEITNNFFCIEGIDGSGKTTLTHAIAEERKLFKLSFQPTQGQYGIKIRSILKKEISVSKDTLLELFILDRKENQLWINEQLQQGFNVILDRYILSSMAYQGLYSNLETIFEKNKEFFVPKMIFFLDITPSIALERRLAELHSQKQSEDLFENLVLQEKIYQKYKESISFLEKKGYLIKYLDATVNKADLLKNCLYEIDQLL